MWSIHPIPLLLIILVGLLLGLVAWGFLRVRGRGDGDALMMLRDDVLLGLLALAAFTLGVFLAYILLGLNW